MAAVYQLKIKYDQDKFEVLFLDARRPVSFPLEDKHAVNEHHVARKSHDRRHTEKNVLTCDAPRDWFETNSWHQKRYSEVGKKIRGCRGLLGRVISDFKKSMF